MMLKTAGILMNLCNQHTGLHQEWLFAFALNPDDYVYTTGEFLTQKILVHGYPFAPVLWEEEYRTESCCGLS